jgi:methyltransferase family protein
MMRPRELIPLSLRREIARGLLPAHEVRLLLEEVRGLRFGRQLAASEHGGRGGSRSTPRRTNRFETYFDSHTVGPGIAKWRHYLDIYDRHFAKFVGREVHVVEVGVASGGSLEMWLDYFGARCHVYGVDIDPGCKIHETESIGISIGDQADPMFWQWFLSEIPQIDIFIDDGGHTARQQVTTFESVFAHIEPGGVYLCEDIQGTTNPFHGYVCGLSRNLNAWDIPRTTDLQKMVGSIHFYPFVTVVERPETPLSGLFSQHRGTKWVPGP